MLMDSTVGKKMSKHKGCTYEDDEIFNPDCAECMRIWADFMEKQNVFVITGMSSDANKKNTNTR